MHLLRSHFLTSRSSGDPGTTTGEADSQGRGRDLALLAPCLSTEDPEVDTTEVAVVIDQRNGADLTGADPIPGRSLRGVIDDPRRRGSTEVPDKVTRNKTLSEWCSCLTNTEIC